MRSNGYGKIVIVREFMLKGKGKRDKRLGQIVRVGELGLEGCGSWSWGRLEVRGKGVRDLG